MGITAHDLAAAGDCPDPGPEALTVLAEFAGRLTHAIGITSCAAIVSGHVTGADLAAPLIATQLGDYPASDATADLLHAAALDMPIYLIPGHDPLRIDGYSTYDIVTGFCIRAADTLLEQQQATGGIAAVTGLNGPAADRANTLAGTWTGTVGALVHHVLT